MTLDYGKKSVQWGVLLGLGMIWGSSFILIKRGLNAFTAEEVASYRIFTVFLILLPFGWKKLGQMRGSRALALLGVGLFGSLIPYFLFAKAQTEIESSLSGILNSLTPLFTLLFAILIFRQRFKARSIWGVLVGFAGAAGLIAFSGAEITWDALNPYLFLPIIASASYGLNVNIIKMYLQNMDPVAVTALGFVVVGPLAGIYLFTSTDFTEHLLHHPEGWASFGYMNILTVVGTALAIFIFNQLIKETSALFASSVTYLIPIIAIFWGVLDDEQLAWTQLAFTGLILLGVSLINSRRRYQKSL